MQTHLGCVNLLVLLHTALGVYHLVHCAVCVVSTSCKILLHTPAMQCSQHSENYLCLLLLIQKSKCKYVEMVEHILQFLFKGIIPILTCYKSRTCHQDLKCNPHPELGLASWLVVLLFPGNCLLMNDLQKVLY